VLKLFKKIFIFFYKIKIIRNYFNLSWNPNYDVTFYHTSDTLDECIKIIGKERFNKATNLLIKQNYDLINHYINKDFNNAIVPIILTIKKKSKKIKILDYGAGSNPVGFYVKKYANLNTYTYAIDKENIVNKNNYILRKRNIKNIKYYKNLNEINNVNTLDLIYFGSSLQYLYNNDYNILKKIFNYNPKILIINRTFFTSLNKDIYCSQAIGRYGLIPNKFYSFNKIVNFFFNFKFKLIFNYDHRQAYIHDNLKNNLFSLKTIIFKSISNKF